MLITPEILTIYILNLLFVVFATIAFVLTLNILKGWQADATTVKQYRLEKQSYLAATIIKYIFYIKLPLFMFFIFTLDTISFILPGAMCGAGVVNSSELSTPLIFLKIINLYAFAFWIVLDAQDMKIESQPYLKKKFYIFSLLYFLLLTEIILETTFFYGIDVESVVDCCGAIFTTQTGTYLSKILGAPLWLQLSLFYGLYMSMLMMQKFQNRYIYAVVNLLFIPISLISLIAFFGTYIYELPTHKCPFCLLQHEYYFVGYLLYALLFLGTFNGISGAFITFNEKQERQRYKRALLFNSLYVLVITLYPLSYYIKNGVWL